MCIRDRGAIRAPVGTPLGGYLRPPVGGDYFPVAEAFEASAEEGFNTFIEEFADFIPFQADNGEPLAPVPDELRAVHSPYATYSPPSRGYYDSLVAKSVAMYDGNDCVILVKTDFIGMLDEVAMAVAEAVESKAPGLVATTMPGCQLYDGLVMSANHSHDGPGAVANHSTRYFWLAVDTYQPAVFEQLVGDLAEVIIGSIQNLKPARFGHAAGREGHDVPGQNDRSLNGFRRSRSPWTADQVMAQNTMRRRLGVLRVDALDGTPIAAIFNYAAHGIIFDVENLYFLSLIHI